MKLISEEVHEAKFLIVETNGIKNYFIEGPFMQAECVNRNGRRYPKHILEREVGRYIKEKVENNNAFGELNHPEKPTINLDRVSHIIKELKCVGNDYIGKAKIIDTPMGKIAKNLLDEQATLAVSTRGVGTLKEENGVNIVQDDFILCTAADLVADPSAPAAWVRGVMEGKEWIMENNGGWTEMDLATAKKIINETVRNKEEMEAKSLQLFEKYLNLLSKH